MEELEPSHKWAQGVTRLAVEKLKEAKVEEWDEAVRVKRWSLAGHISRREDGRW